MVLEMGIPFEEANGMSRIVLVSSNTILSNVIESILVDEGYSVLCSKDGAAALSTIYKLNKVHLLITDYILSGDMNGVHLAQLVRQNYPNIAIIFMSDCPERFYPLRFLGSCQRLSKPVSPSLLVKSVSGLVGRECLREASNAR